MGLWRHIKELEFYVQWALDITDPLDGLGIFKKKKAIGNEN